MHGTRERDADAQHDLEYYLPATAGLSSRPGLVERTLARMFRRRGPVRKPAPVEER